MRAMRSGLASIASIVAANMLCPERTQRNPFATKVSWAIAGEQSWCSPYNRRPCHFEPQARNRLRPKPSGADPSATANDEVAAACGRIWSPVVTPGPVAPALLSVQSVLLEDAGTGRSAGATRVWSFSFQPAPAGALLRITLPLLLCGWRTRFPGNANNFLARCLSAIKQI